MPAKMLNDRCAIVTGAADGIGRAIVDLFTSEGANVLAVDIQPERLNAGYADDARVTRLLQDISHPDSPTLLVNAATKAFKQLDILVNNAGTPGDYASLLDTSDQSWSRVINLNLDTAFRIIRHAIPLLKQSPHARIINTASVCGQQGITFLSAYCASKAGLVGLTRAVAVEVGPMGITANCILPGNTVTGLTRHVFADPESEEGKKFIARTCVLGRYGQPADMAGAALYLASDLASYVTGQNIVVDGGLTMRIPNALD